MSTLRCTNLQDTSGSNSLTTAQIYNGAAKAWVNFNGTGTVAIRAQFNVSSITDNGTGRYTINFSNAFADSSYAFVAIGQYEFSCGPASESAASYTTTSAAIWHGRYGTGTSNDGVVISVAIFR